MSQLLSKTIRQDPSDTESVSHRLMLKSGMISQVAAGVYAYLPLALRSLRKIEQILREEMDAAGGQEIRMPALQPAEIWQESGREASFGPTLFHLKDRRDRELVLAPTHEEVVTHLVKSNLNSYRDLPLLIYQIQTKFRDEARPRAGLLRGREFGMKDAYSFDIDSAGGDLAYNGMVEAYKNVFERCGLPTFIVEADSGAIGGKDSHEFVMPAETGEDIILRCANCGYSANSERARFRLVRTDEPTLLPLEKVETPGMTSIDDVSKFLDVLTSQTLKTMIYMAHYPDQPQPETVLVLLRGDLEVNEVKLKNSIGAINVRLTTPEENSREGITIGYTSPIGFNKFRCIADESVFSGNNFVVGANESGFHYMNANNPRDFAIDHSADIALARSGDGCPECDSRLEALRGIEVGHVFKLGTSYSEKFGATFLTDLGQQQPCFMGCYGIGVTRVLAAAIEQNHDDKGIIFPLPIAPYQIHLVALNNNEHSVIQAADALYADLNSKGFEVLYDDRIESAGVKFNDVDLLGLPVRLVLSSRTLANGETEIKLRNHQDPERIPLEGLSGRLASIFA